MDSTVWGAVGAAVVMVVGACGLAAKQIIMTRAKILMKRMERADPTLRLPQSEMFTRMICFHTQVELVKKLPNVQRILLFAGANGGGLPDPGKPYRVISKYGWAEDPHPNPHQNYNYSLQVDRGYCELLQRMIRDGRAVVTYASMSDFMLKKYYHIEGVVQSVMYLLSVDQENGEIMYLSVASYNREFTDGELQYIDVRVDRMRSILSKGGDGSAPQPTP